MPIVSKFGAFLGTFSGKYLLVPQGCQIWVGNVPKMCQKCAKNVPNVCQTCANVHCAKKLKLCKVNTLNCEGVHCLKFSSDIFFSLFGKHMKTALGRNKYVEMILNGRKPFKFNTFHDKSNQNKTQILN